MTDSRDVWKAGGFGGIYGMEMHAALLKIDNLAGMLEFGIAGGFGGDL